MSIFSDILLNSVEENRELIFGGKDLITGSNGNDSLIGYDGNDRLYGGRGRRQPRRRKRLRQRLCRQR
ncbi:hypothetical protein [Methylobacterium sp. CM6244]